MEGKIFIKCSDILKPVGLLRGLYEQDPTVYRKYTTHIRVAVAHMAVGVISRVTSQHTRERVDGVDDGVGGMVRVPGVDDGVDDHGRVLKIVALSSQFSTTLYFQKYL